MFWEKYIESEGCKDIQINVKWNIKRLFGDGGQKH
jgi:hypothetical protein